MVTAVHAPALRPSLLLPVTLLAALASCSDAHDVAFRVTLAGDVPVPPGVFIAFVIAEGTPVEGATAKSQVPVTQGVRTYQGKSSICCKPAPTVELFAFIDLDGDRQLDFDEPRGADPKNPVTLADGSTAYSSAIVITLAPTATP